MANARIALGDLEKDFVMVQWDQPGSGKSRHAVPLDSNPMAMQCNDTA
jgi:hypothetical protein